MAGCLEFFMIRSVRKAVCFGFAAGLALGLAQFSPTTVHAAGYEVGSLHIAQPWARATPKGATAGAAYMTITNSGTAPDRVSCLSSDAGDKCQIHSVIMEGSTMKMRPVEGGLEIKPGETIVLKPSGLHIMLTGLKHPLREGSAVKATLKFENAGTLDIECPVVAFGAAAPGSSASGGAMKHDHHMMQMDKR
jgi:copper(I)-binding protein